MGPDGVLGRVVAEAERLNILTFAHEGFGGGHYGAEITVKKVMQQGLWWPTIHQDKYKHVKTCDRYQRLKPINEGMEFHPIIAPHLFQKWGLDFVGPINSMS